MKTYTERIKELPPVDWQIEELKKNAYKATKLLEIEQAKLTAKERNDQLEALKQEMRTWKSPEYKTYWDAVAKISEEWHTDLRKEYDDVGDATYNSAYGMAYERSHSSGCDEVASTLNEVIYFLRELEKTTGIKFTHK